MRYVKRAVLVCGAAALLCWLFSVAAYATGSGDVAGAVESTWAAASGQIKTVVNNVVFPAIDMILAIFFFVKLGTAYFDYLLPQHPRLCHQKTDIRRKLCRIRTLIFAAF